MKLNIYENVNYRNDLQGIRAISAILIMIYHIWFSRVSGGVDIFFVISGYFMGGMLIRSFLKNGNINPFYFWGRIIKRIAPLAYTVIACTLIAGYFLLPPNLWRESITDIITSALHIENWQLIRSGTDYLADSRNPNPLQQFWALSLQIQFYLILPFLTFIALYISNYFKNERLISCFFILISFLSLIFSIYYTNINPAASYFHIGSRMWEFLLGVTVFFVSPFIKISLNKSRFLMWFGLILLLSIGILIPENFKYPGYIALLPVTAAIFLILAGNKTDYKSKLYNLLTSKPLVYIGGISFSLYLWHWPILIYTQHYLNLNPGNLSFLNGFFIISLSFILSIISKNLIEKPFNIKSNKIIHSYMIGFLFFIMVLPVSFLLRSELIKLTKIAESYDYVGNNLYDGDKVYLNKEHIDLDLKRLISVKYDLTEASLNQKCSKGIENGDIVSCELSNIDSSRSILMVGGSRIAHWEPFFSYLGNKYDFKVINATTNGCSFGYNPKGDLKCKEWNDNIIDYISKISPKPEFVIVNTSRNDNESEYIPFGYIENIQKVLNLGIPVIGIRITPKFNFNPNSCLWKNQNDPSICSLDKYLSLEKENPIVEIKHNLNLKNLYIIDFKDVICSKNECPVIFNSFPTMRDEAHFTRSFIQYMSGSLENSLNKQAPIFLDTFDKNN